MASLNGAPADTVAPGQADTSITKEGFKITTRKLPILKAGPIEEMTKKLGIAPPEMIFGDNMVRIEHAQSGWYIEFNAFDALDSVDKTGDNMFKVAYSKEWQQNRQKQFEDIKEVVKPFDWSYSTDYKGTTPPTPAFEPTETPIPLALLKRPDPIHFFDELVLYEDELADNGIAMLSCKIRVMPQRLLLLVRFFMRLDDVVFRMRDTRVFVEFGDNVVLREYTAREEKYENVRKKLAGRKEDVLAIMRDPNRLAEHIPIVEHKLEGLQLNNDVGSVNGKRPPKSAKPSTNDHRTITPIPSSFILASCRSTSFKSRRTPLILQKPCRDAPMILIRDAMVMVDPLSCTYLVYNACSRSCA